MVETGKLSSWKDDKVQNQALEVFTNSLCSHQYGGMYYVADVFERYREDRDISEDSERMLFELYSQAASLGYALAYFKVALLYIEDYVGIAERAITRCIRIIWCWPRRQGWWKPSTT